MGGEGGEFSVWRLTQLPLRPFGLFTLKLLAIFIFFPKKFHNVQVSHSPN